ncbi:MAG: hypothetical protein JWL89_26 [Candidatus Saccharibacteria bacterium]|nr:hypothetical protein [Candidatus Saccharibacteria bacterium]
MTEFEGKRIETGNEVTLAKEFAEEHNLDLAADTLRVAKEVGGLATPGFDFIPEVAQLDEEGTYSQRVVKDGADYLFTQIDFRHRTGRIEASRKITTILAGNRTEAAYWSLQAPPKEVDIHQGIGRLWVGDPSQRAGVPFRDFRLYPETTPRVVLPPGCFYTIEAEEYTPEPLVVSGFYNPPVDFANLEVYPKPGDREIDAPEGRVKVQVGFRARYL